MGWYTSAMEENAICSICSKPVSATSLVNRLQPPERYLCDECAHIGKYCSDCKAYKLFRAFSPASKGGTNRGGVGTYCKVCKARQRKADYNGKTEKERKQERSAHLARKYDLTDEEYAAMWERQQGLCAICGEPEKRWLKGTMLFLAIDHDHRTGLVRELLCHDCNLMLGRAHDDPEILRQATAYLEKHTR